MIKKEGQNSGQLVADLMLNHEELFFFFFFFWWMNHVELSNMLIWGPNMGMATSGEAVICAQTKEATLIGMERELWQEK